MSFLKIIKYFNNSVVFWLVFIYSILLLGIYSSTANNSEKKFILTQPKAIEMQLKQ